ncbi:MAG: DegT/DnrJ/EryC1/StrS family aminotransferase [Victivallaceae bacterium]|nr:DegT/DnrJ/EryC1/StrS family aminotransferase [Victivallaceae bacterium]
MGIDWPYEFPGVYWVGKEEEEAVLEVLRNGSMFRYYGLKKPFYVDRFEESARNFYGVNYALGLNSGTGALICSLAALGIGPGCEVVIPSFLWVATVGAVVQCGAIPVICEVNDSFNIDPEDLERKITAKTKLIVPVHMAGAPCEMDKIMEIADRHGIPVLEDCAQCNGGSFKGKKVGTFGRMGIFSLQLNKNITCGEGGLIITGDERLYNRAFSAHDMGMIRKNGRLALPDDYAVMWGNGRRMNEMCGAVANVQLSKLPDITGKMHSSKKRIKEMLQDTRGLEFRRLADEAGDSGPFLVIILEDEKTTLAAVEKMKRNGLHNIFRIADYGLHIYFNIPALVNKTPLSPSGNPWNLCANKDSDYDYSKGACPQSDKLFSRSILIPVPSCLTAEQEERAAQIISEAVNF